MYNAFQKQNPYMQQQMGMQPNQSMDPRAPIAQPQQPMVVPAWAQQMGQPPQNGAAHFSMPQANPINAQVNTMLESEGMTGKAPGNSMAGMQAAQMGMGMLKDKDDSAQRVMQQRRQMTQAGMDRMQQLALMMRNRTG